MKRISALLLVVLLFLFAAVTAIAQTPTVAPDEIAAVAKVNAEGDQTIISATGSTRIMLTADIAVLTIGVRAAGNTVIEAQTSADATLATLSEALVGMNIEVKDIQTTFYSVQTVYSYQYSKLGEQETPTGYSVSTDMVVRLRDISRIGEVVDLVVNGGADSNYELTFESTQYDDVYHKALQDALADAMNKADLLAQGAGVTLGKLRSVTELTNADNTFDVTATVANDLGNVPMHSELSVVATVQVCYDAE